MSPEERQQLGASLFKSSSAFDTPEVELPEPSPLVQPADTSRSDWEEVGNYLGDVLFLIDDRRGESTPLLREVEEALEEIERVVRRRA